MLRRLALKTILTLPMAAAASPRHVFSSSRLSLCTSVPDVKPDKDKNKDNVNGPNKGINFFDMLDKVKSFSTAATPPKDTAEPAVEKHSPSSFSSFDDYTLGIMNDLKLSLEKHESSLREKAALHESSLRETLSGPQSAIQTALQTLNRKRDDVSSSSSFDLLDLIPASILDSRSKTSLRDLSGVCERINGEFQSTVTHFNHPFLVNLGLLRLYSIRQQQSHQSHLLLQSHSQSKQALAVSTGTVEETAAKGVVETDPRFLAHVRHFLRFADEVYEDQSSLYLSPQDVVVRELGDQNNADRGIGGRGSSEKLGEGEEEKKSEERRTLHLPRYVVFLDHLTESVVVVIRGTASVSDLVTDLHCSTRPFLHAPTVSSSDTHCKQGEQQEQLQAHTGISLSAEELLPPVEAAIAAARNRSGGAFRHYKVVVTGHSLGAGTACLLSMLLAARDPRQHITTFAFAPPPILAKAEYSTPPSAPSSSFTSFSSSSLPAHSPPLPRNLDMHCFVLGQDLIPRCSLHEVLAMLRALSAIDRLQGPRWTGAARATLLLRGEEELTEDDMQCLSDAVMKAAAAHRQREKEGAAGGARAGEAELELEPSEDVQLIIPGHVYWLLPRTGDVGATSAASAATNTVTDGGSKDASSFSLVRMQACGDIFSGHLFSGDNMFRDHLVSSYRRAMLAVGGGQEQEGQGKRE